MSYETFRRKAGAGRSTHGGAPAALRVGLPCTALAALLLVAPAGTRPISAQDGVRICNPVLDARGTP